jgi:hypothetical protein
MTRPVSLFCLFHLSDYLLGRFGNDRHSSDWGTV